MPDVESQSTSPQEAAQREAQVAEALEAKMGPEAEGSDFEIEEDAAEEQAERVETVYEDPDATIEEKMAAKKAALEAFGVLSPDEIQGELEREFGPDVVGEEEEVVVRKTETAEPVVAKAVESDVPSEEELQQLEARQYEEAPTEAYAPMQETAGALREQAESAEGGFTNEAKHLDLITDIQSQRQILERNEELRADLAKKIEETAEGSEERGKLARKLENIDAKSDKAELELKNAWDELNKYKQDHPNEVKALEAKERMLHEEFQIPLWQLEVPPKSLDWALSDEMWDRFPDPMTHPYIGQMVSLGISRDNARELMLKYAENDPVLSEEYAKLADQLEAKRLEFKDYLAKTEDAELPSTFTEADYQKLDAEARERIQERVDVPEVAEVIAPRPENLPPPRLYKKDENGRFVRSKKGEPIPDETEEYRRAREKAEAKEAGYINDMFARGAEADMSLMRDLAMEIEKRSDIHTGTRFTEDELKKIVKEQGLEGDALEAFKAENAEYTDEQIAEKQQELNQVRSDFKTEMGIPERAEPTGEKSEKAEALLARMRAGREKKERAAAEKAIELSDDAKSRAVQMVRSGKSLREVMNALQGEAKNVKGAAERVFSEEPTQARDVGKVREFYEAETAPVPEQTPADLVRAGASAAEILKALEENRDQNAAK